MKSYFLKFLEINYDFKAILVTQPIIVARPLHESWFKNLKSPFKILNTRNHDHMCKNLKINVLKINHTYIKSCLSRSRFHNFKFQILKYFCEFIQLCHWSANKIQWTNDVILNKDCICFWLIFFFSYNVVSEQNLLQTFIKNACICPNTWHVFRKLSF